MFLKTVIMQVGIYLWTFCQERHTAGPQDRRNWLFMSVCNNGSACITEWWREDLQPWEPWVKHLDISWSTYCFSHLQEVYRMVWPKITLNIYWILHSCWKLQQNLHTSGSWHHSSCNFTSCHLVLICTDAQMKFRDYVLMTVVAGQGCRKNFKRQERSHDSKAAGLRWLI